MSASTAVRLVAAWRSRATVAAGPQGRVAGTPGKLAAHRAFLVEVVQAEPDITLKALAGALLQAAGVQAAGVQAAGVQANVSSLHRALKACGHTDKKRPDRVRA